ncbi:MAG: hypothetical protein MMC33_002670 [Icmadophila ericetorum]|nr:hypothetical protein [Icmadophila ericetorum]
MSLANPYLGRCYLRCLRAPLKPPIAAPVSLIQHRRRAPPTQRWQSTAASSPKVSNIIDQISQLTLLETADLVSGLKSKLNIPDMPIGSFSAGPSAPAAAAAPVEEEAAAPAAQEKTLFTLTLKSFDAAAKPKIIKEVKSMLGLSLVDSKKFVESAPKMMKEGVPKEEAAKIIETLKGLGGVVTME